MKVKKIKADISWLASKIRPKKRFLAVEIIGDKILGAVTASQGKRIEVYNFVAIDRSNAGDDLPDPANLAEIMERLNYPEGPVVLVTPLARSVQITMNKAKVDSLRHYQLRDSLRWEVEPFTGISGTQALVGVEKGQPAVQEDLMMLTEEEEELGLNVSVIEQNAYRAMKQVCRRANLRLARLYPPEACFFMPLFLDRVEGAQAVMDIGQDYASFIVIKGKQATQISTYPLGKEVLLELADGAEPGDSESSLRFLVGQVPGPLPLMLTGPGAIVPKIVDYLGTLCETGVEPLKLQRIDKLSEAGDEGMNAIYSIAVGAAVRELSGQKWRMIGITDAVPLGVKAKQSAYLLPLGATVLLATGLFGHYQYMKISKERLKKQNTELTAKVKEKKQSHAAYEKLQTELGNIRKDIMLTRKQIAFVEGGSDDNMTHVEQVLSSFYALPQQMLLDTVLQKEDGRFLITGRSKDFEVVGRFAVELQQHPWCEAVDIKVLEHNGDGNLHFQVEMNADPATKDS